MKADRRKFFWSYIHHSHILKDKDTLFRTEILETLLKFKTSNMDIVDCILAAHSSSEKVVVSFDKDFEKLKAVIETL